VGEHPGRGATLHPGGAVAHPRARGSDHGHDRGAEPPRRRAPRRPRPALPRPGRYRPGLSLRAARPVSNTRGLRRGVFRDLPDVLSGGATGALTSPAPSPMVRSRRRMPGGGNLRLPRERFDYSAIVDRPPLRLPRAARVAVWTIVNVEEWDIQGPMPRTVLPPPAGGSGVPDVPNWAWHDYGMRVGFWRLKAALDRYRIKATLAINASVCLSYPRGAKAGPAA